MTVSPVSSALAAQAGYLIGIAARAPSLHNTQPWQFKAGEHAIEMYADTSRQLRIDPDGREMLISCGAALYGLRLAMRTLGNLPEVNLLPESARPRLLARVRLGPAKPLTADERKMLLAVQHRHTHRGPFEPGPLPAGLRAGQALYRLLLQAASQWVFADLNTQPLEDAVTRGQIRDALTQPGWPQMLLSLGVSRTTHATARRPAADLTVAAELSPRRDR